MRKRTTFITWLRIGAVAVGLLMVALTGLALIETDEWWIRVLDFPRLQIAAVLAVALVAYLATRPRAMQAWPILTTLVAALVWQLWLIAPYSPVWQKQMLDGSACDQSERARFLLANVLQSNRDVQSFLNLVSDVDPDIVLLTEIDAWWVEQIDGLEQTHPHQVLEPLSNTFGIGLYSRLPLSEPEVRYLLEDHIPSITTDVALSGGQTFTLWGVHPAPPRPGDDTDERDAELLIVAKEAARMETPTVVAGDLNDVAWSSTTTLFQEISGMLDPRIGRGLHATFNADWPLLKWPLDHLFASDEWTLGEFRRLDDIGSDHFPILVELCHQPAAAALQHENRAEPGDAAEADEHIREGMEAAGDD